jgi:hypothetical protein
MIPAINGCLLSDSSIGSQEIGPHVFKVDQEGCLAGSKDSIGNHDRLKHASEFFGSHAGDVEQAAHRVSNGSFCLPNMWKKAVELVEDFKGDITSKVAVFGQPEQFVLSDLHYSAEFIMVKMVIATRSGNQHIQERLKGRKSNVDVSLRQVSLNRSTIDTDAEYVSKEGLWGRDNSIDVNEALNPVASERARSFALMTITRQSIPRGRLNDVSNRNAPPRPGTLRVRIVNNGKDIESVLAFPLSAAVIPIRNSRFPDLPVQKVSKMIDLLDQIVVIVFRNRGSRCIRRKTRGRIRQVWCTIQQPLKKPHLTSATIRTLCIQQPRVAGFFHLGEAA